MKSFRFLSITFLALLFAVACGGGALDLNDQRGENPDENQQDTDSDSDMTDSGDDSDSSDSGDSVTDTGDSGTDTGDSGEHPDSGDTLTDGDTPSDNDPDGDPTGPDDEPQAATPEEICLSKNGTFHDDGTCTREFECGNLPALAEWNISGTTTQHYDFEAGAWELVTPAEYDDSENPGPCSYRCSEGTKYEGNSCKNLCAAKFNGEDSYIFLDNDPRSIFDSDMGSTWTIEFWYKQETAPEKSNSAAPVLRRGGSSVMTPTFGFYPIQKYTQQTSPIQQDVYGYLRNSFQTTYSYKDNQWSQQTQTKELSYSFEYQQLENLYENEWVHVAVTGESTQFQQNWQNKAKLVLKLYVNGVYLGEEDGSGNIDAVSTISLKSMDDGLYIGANLKYSLYFSGLVSGLRISDEIVYNGDFTPSYNLDAAESTLESWKFDRGQIVKAVAGETVSESDIHNVEWSTDCPGQD